MELPSSLSVLFAGKIRIFMFSYLKGSEWQEDLRRERLTFFLGRGSGGHLREKNY